MKIRQIVKDGLSLALGLMAFVCSAGAATAFGWRADCIGRFSLELPGKAEVAMVVNKAFENAKDDPRYPTKAAVAFLEAGGGIHFSDGEETLANIKGFITALPIHWTEGENLRTPFPTMLVTQNDRKPKKSGTLETQTAFSEKANAEEGKNT